ncbi:MAG: hypothetical protein ACR2LU_03685 [Luteitalea sp.]
MTCLLVSGPALAQVTERVSVAANGSQAVGGRYSPRPSVSRDGTTVAFESPLVTLVPNDTNNFADVFISSGGVVSRILGPGGVQPNCGSQRASVSADGRYVTFDSCANNLVAGDTNNVNDVFRYDTIGGALVRVSVATDGSQGVGPSFSSAISSNGQYVAFLSSSTNLVAGASGTQVYLRDVTNGTTFLVSRASGVSGVSANVGSTTRPAVANNGDVAFATQASNLVAGDTNAAIDVFVRTFATSATTRVSLSEASAQLTGASNRPGITDDGRLVVFESTGAGVASDTNALSDVYLRDLTAGTTVLISRTPAGNGGNGNSADASISPSGSFVAFSSQAADLAGSFDSVLDIFRATLTASGPTFTPSTITKITNSLSTASGNSTSADVADAGRVVYASDEPNLVAGDVNGDTDVFASDGAQGPVRLTRPAASLGESSSGTSLRPQPSYDGTIVAFLSSTTNLVPGDVNGTVDVFVRNRVSGATDRLPVPVGSETIDADWLSISHDGRFIAYSRGAAFLYDRFNGTTTVVSVASAGGATANAAQPRVSAGGRYVAYVTAAAFDAADTNNVADVYLYDRIAGTSAWVSKTSVNGPASGVSITPVVSADGRTVVFASSAANLVAGDTNNRQDIFVRDLVANTTTRVSTNVDTAPAGTEARDPFLSADGNYVTYLLSSNVLTTEASAASDVYVVRRDGTALRGPLNGATEGTAPAQGSYDPTVSMFGRYLSYRSYASDLVAGDTNAAADAFARQILGAAPTTPFFGPAQRTSLSGGGAQATGGTGADTENPEISGNGSAVAFQSGFSNLVANDTNFIVDAFIRTGIFPGECTFIEASLPGYTAFATRFGLDPCSNAGSPFADPDGDGFTNTQEQSGLGDGNPVLGTFTRYFAEGATKTAGLNFDVRIALANPSPAVVTGEITYQLPSGVAVPATPFTLQPYERATVLLDEQPGINENGPAAAYEFATTIKASAPIGIDRTMTWDKSTYAAHAETGVVSPSRTWYFAEGATIGGFNLFYLLQNPSAQPVTLEGRYLLGNGQVFTKSYTLAPNSRFNVWANVEQINGATPLASAEFSAVFTVTTGANIIAERAMYRGGSPLFKAGHESAGITEPATEWFLAEGNAGDFFDEFVLIGNTTGSAALVQADFIVGGATPTVYTKQYTVIPNSRFNIWVDQEEVAPGLFPFRSGNTDVSVRIRSLNGVPLIVERAMWWPGSSDTWYEAHNSPATSRTASRWVLAEGEHGGPLGWQTFILVANTGPAAGTVRIRLLLPNGQTAELTGQALAARSRTTYFLADLLAAAGLPTTTKAGVLIESEGAALPLVVERAMYRNANGQTFVVGTNALGTPLP